MPIVNSQKEFDKYKEFIGKSKYANFMQYPSWSKVKKNWSHDFVYVEENKQIIAAMSVIGIKNDNGKTFLYAPRGPVCDFSDYKLVQKLIKEAEALREKYDAFLLRIDPEFEFKEREVKLYKSLGYEFRSVCDDIYSFIQPRYNLMINLTSKDEGKVFKNFSSKGRYNVRKSFKSNIVTKLDTSKESLDNFYNLTKIMAKRQGINHRPKSYFKKLIKHMNAMIFSAYHEDQILSASLLIPNKDKLYYLYAASSNEKRNLMPNYNMIWEEIKYAIENGYSYLDLGGVFSLSKKDGLYRFKENFCYPNKYKAYIGELDVVYDREKYEEFLKQK